MKNENMEEYEKTALLKALSQLMDSGKYMEIARKKLIGVYGLGGAGSNILASLYEMGLKEMKNVETVVINSDENVLEHLKDADKRVLIGKSMSERLKGTAGDTELAKKMIVAARESLEVMVGQHQALVLIGSLGGGTGAELLIELSRIGMEQKKLVIAIAVLPFSVEGERRARAKRKLKVLESTGAMVVPMDNDSLVRDERLRKLSLDRAFESLNRIIFRKIREIQDDTLESIVDAIVEDMYRKLKESSAETKLPEMVTSQISVPNMMPPNPPAVTASPETAVQEPKEFPEDVQKIDN